MNKEDQKILAVPTKKFFPDGIWSGFRMVDSPEEIFEIVKKFGEYRRRGDLEEDPSWKQIIVQIVLIVGEKLFIHKIPKTGNESRLHDLFPIFLGGHVEESDLGLEAAADREFGEESGYAGKILQKEFVGVVNLQDNSVNRVHAGLVWAFIGDSELFKNTGDDGVVEGKFVTWEEAEKMTDQMSYWSREAFPVLRKKYGK